MLYINSYLLEFLIHFDLLNEGLDYYILHFHLYVLFNCDMIISLYILVSTSLLLNFIFLDLTIKPSF
ncbi:hypothetical protein C1645_45040 [Glomus cerebriforme]|uniref:Uncharacterized protein n=1 Tax=Glomus cerebriforme TaxID=658196 RepID=A0A397RZY9_9GLOM|nr:hypothetical protein C1645_45040 [Glomus cerebriforme]